MPAFSDMRHRTIHRRSVSKMVDDEDGVSFVDLRVSNQAKNRG